MVSKMHQHHHWSVDALLGMSVSDNGNLVYAGPGPAGCNCTTSAELANGIAVDPGFENWVW